MDALAKRRMVFRFMARVYQSWWRKRIDTPDKLAAEIAAFDAVLAGLSDAEIRGGFKAILVKRADYKLSPVPTADEFGRLCLGAAPVVVKSLRAPVASVDARRYLDEIKVILCG